MLAVGTLAALAIPAPAMADRSFETSGSITYEWQGDPVRGCAAEGLCSVQGALILQSQSGSSSTSGGPPGGGIDVPLETSGSTVRVSDGPGAGECLDVPSELFGGDLLIRRAAGGRLVGHLDPQLSSGRCAGPLAQDLAALTLPVRRTGGRLPTFDLGTTQSFAVGPFTGRLVSTLVVRSMPSAAGSGLISTGPPPATAPRAHKVFVEQVALRYRIASLPGSFDIAFSGEADPFCTALDSCGASGTLAFSLIGLRQTFEVQGFRQVSRRLNARQVLADFRRGRLQVSGGPGGRPRGGATAQVTETYAGLGGLHCQDTTDSRSLAPVFLEPGPPRARGDVSLALGESPGLNLLRTYCPGPADTDVFGSSGPLARTSIRPAQLLAPQSIISVTAPGSFAGLGYVGTSSGALRFALTLERVHAGTRQVTRP
jgi:hypothetical protein